MKKIFTVLIILLVIFTFVYCGGKEQPKPQPKPEPKPNPKPQQTTDYEAIRKQINNDLLFRIEVYNFPPDSWDLQKHMGPTLDKLANILNKLMRLAKKINADNKIQITVIGYADTSGTMRRKMTVSENRAKKVINYLVDKKGFSRDIFKAQWRGDQELKDPNDPLSGKNRRVVVYFEGISGN
jgi:outer membrane protein OmpA-like peptidoglycan-associated protein